ncbi:receptor homology region, transmembrane domain- and RING domain-containing protein 6-like [Cornus florida]|uniref:receptor homology region, transmembrane domain- and RING domain-containing protein 6-like n=1 Tax=Cornus florida TaxID=4283 RepID=UPI00289CE342|nr:receptor homology region, transmembrane domain- and RING domain-containing protein 6-like [Cornus florida]
MGKCWHQTFVNVKLVVAKKRPQGTSNLSYAFYGGSRTELANIIVNEFSKCSEPENGVVLGSGVYLSPVNYSIDSIHIVTINLCNNVLSAVPDENGLRHVGGDIGRFGTGSTRSSEDPFKYYIITNEVSRVPAIHCAAKVPQVLEEYAFGDEVGRLGCEHAFHMVCVHQWLQLKNWCPICKASATPSQSPLTV